MNACRPERIKRIRSALLVFLIAGTALYAEGPDFVKFEIAKGHFTRGLVHFNRNRYLAAVEHFRKAVNAYPRYHTARDYLSRSYQYAGFTDEAIRELENLYSMSENVAVKGRIDSLRFRNSAIKLDEGIGDLIINRTYRSSDFKQKGFSNPSGSVVDSRGNIYIASFSEGRIVKIDTNGNAVDVYRPAVGGKYYGIDIAGDVIAVTDFTGDRVYLLNLEGKIIRQFGASGSGEGQFHGPSGIAFGKSGDLFVVDAGNSRVQRFNGKGEFVLQFGKAGNYEGEFDNPSGIALDETHVYLADTGNRRIAQFDQTGNFIRNLQPGDIAEPVGVNVRDGKLYIADRKKGLLEFSPDTGNVSWFSTWDNGKERFGSLMSAVFDREGNVLAVDYGRHAVFMFTPVQKLYSNLQVEITAVDAAKFPTVAWYLNIRRKDGKPVFGLERENFTVIEDGARITQLSTGFLKKMRPSVTMVFCVDRSVQGKRFSNDVPWAADFILEKMYKNDLVKVVDFNGDYWQSSPFDWSRRRTLKAMGQGEYSQGKAYGRTIYNAMSELVPRFTRRGVVIFTDGTVDEESFNGYSEENIIDFAKTHFIPVYFVSFGEAADSLKRIARSTGGKVIGPGQVNELRKIYDELKNQEEYRYLMLYSTFKSARLKGLWSDVRIEVNYKSQIGSAHGGYFVP